MELYGRISERTIFMPTWKVFGAFFEKNNSKSLNVWQTLEI